MSGLRHDIRAVVHRLYYDGLEGKGPAKEVIQQAEKSIMDRIRHSWAVQNKRIRTAVLKTRAQD